MNRQSVSIIKSLVLATSLAFGLAGCTADTGSEEPAPTQAGVTNQLVTAEDVTELAPGERLHLDVKDNVVYRFDYSDAPIDFARVELAYGSEVITMQDARDALLAFDYGTNEPVDLTGAPDGRFGVAWDPTDFGALGEAALAELKETGYVYREKGAENAKTQNEDPCIYAVCEICPWGWGNGPCFYEQHVWCD